MNLISDARPCIAPTDTELAKKVRIFLNANRIGFRRISIWAEAETVRLSGPVSSFYLRQMAIAIAKRVAGVRHVVDDLQVGLEPTDSRHNAEPLKIHDAWIYHCLTCGRAEHVAFDSAPPQCCEHTMVKTCEEASQQSEVPEETRGALRGSATGDQGLKKPR